MKKLSKMMAVLLMLIGMLGINANNIKAEVDYLHFEAKEDNSSVKLVTEGMPDFTLLEYSINGAEWQFYMGDVISLPTAGDIVALRNVINEVDTFSIDDLNFYRFEMTGKLAVGGNITTLVKKDGGLDHLNAYEFFCLFHDCDELVDASELELPSMYLAGHCYDGMFDGCSNLVKGPKELPATIAEEYCYSTMFKDCGSLEEAPIIDVTLLDKYSFNEMFEGCTRLEKAPKLLPTKMEEGAYCGMFANCTSLNEAPELPATQLATICYFGMFLGDICLNEAPELPAMKLEEQCYVGMFKDTGLKDIPELPARILADYCYLEMFRGCTGIDLSMEQTLDYNIPCYIPSDKYEDYGPIVPATNSFLRMFEEIGGDQPIPNFGTPWDADGDDIIVVYKKGYRVDYAWSGDIPAGLNVPTDSKAYQRHEQPIVDSQYNSSTKINGKKDGKDGVYSFSGWDASNDPDLKPAGIEGNVTYSGVWKFTENSSPAPKKKNTYVAPNTCVR